MWAMYNFIVTVNQNHHGKFSFRPNEDKGSVWTVCSHKKINCDSKNSITEPRDAFKACRYMCQGQPVKLSMRRLLKCIFQYIIPRQWVSIGYGSSWCMVRLRVPIQMMEWLVTVGWDWHDYHYFSGTSHSVNHKTTKHHSNSLSFPKCTTLGWNYLPNWKDVILLTEYDYV